MDARLLARAREVGVEVREDSQVTSVVLDAEGVVRGVRYRNAETIAADVRARVTLDATGRARVLGRAAQRVARSSGGQLIGSTTPEKKMRERASLVAFKAHLVGARGLAMNESSSRASRCEIYFYDGGYGGLNNVEGAVSNVCFIVGTKDVRRCGGDAERVLHEIVFRNERARHALAESRAVTRWLSVALESFGRGELAPAPGLLAIGDAASFIDPFTGSGMLMALESGETAARSISAWHKESANATASDEQHALAALSSAYAASYAERFDYRLRVCSYLRRAAFAPSFAIETAITLLGMNSSVRRRFATATRGAARPGQGFVAEEN
jgi:flavin-dependent dehydrogenase